MASSCLCALAAIVFGAFDGALAVPGRSCFAEDSSCQDVNSLLQVEVIATNKAISTSSHRLDKAREHSLDIKSPLNVLRRRKPSPNHTARQAPARAPARYEDWLESWLTPGSQSEPLNAELQSKDIHKVVKAVAISLSVLMLFWSSYKLQWWSHPQALLLLNCLSLGVCSWGMNIVNKSLVAQLKSPILVTAAQMVTTLIITGISSRCRLTGSKMAMLTWSIVSLVLFLMLLSSFYTYKYLTLSVLMIVRNFGPLVALPVEQMIMPSNTLTPISFQAVLAILVILFSTFLYLSNSSFSRLGFACAIVNMVLAVFDRVLQRWLLLTHCKKLTIETCMLVGNFFGLIPTLLLAYAVGEFEKFDSEVWLKMMSVVLLLLSGTIGAGICYFTIAIGKEVSATSYLVLTNAVRVAAVVMGIVAFHDPVGWPWRAIGLVTSFLGSLWYGYARIVAGESNPGSEESKSMSASK